MSGDDSRRFYVPSPGERGGSPAPPAGDAAPDQSGSIPASSEAASSPGPQAPRQVYVPAQPKPSPRAAGPPTAIAPVPPQPQQRAKPPSRRRRRRKRWVALAILCVPLLALGGFALYLYSLFAGINRVDLTGTLSPVDGPGVNYLIAGSDQRADGSVAGERADTLIVLRVGEGTPTMMSVPRDLWVTIAETGQSAKINAAYSGGPQRLVATVQQSLQIPIHHYVEVDFVTFGDLVDAVGGVEVEFPHPAFDEGSGLSVEQAGTVTLDGEQALAYVRSRRYTEVIDGMPRQDPTADLGRQQRQQTFMKAVMGKVGATRNPAGLTRVAQALGNDLTIDDDLSAWGALGLVRGLAGTSPESVVLPTAPGREGAQSVLYLVDSEAGAVLEQFR